jgi:hypothetical protein
MNWISCESLATSQDHAARLHAARCATGRRSRRFMLFTCCISRDAFPHDAFAAPSRHAPAAAPTHPAAARLAAQACAAEHRNLLS